MLLWWKRSLMRSNISDSIAGKHLTGYNNFPALTTHVFSKQKHVGESAHRVDAYHIALRDLDLR